MEIIRKGEASVHMVFNENKKTFSYYDVPTESCLWSWRPDGSRWRRRPTGSPFFWNTGWRWKTRHVADCLVEIRVESKSTCRIDLAG